MNKCGFYDDAVVGAGVIGLAHAYQLARRGRRVIVFERNARAVGASVRNFGMLWPIGQPFGPRRDMAQKSLLFWLDVLSASGLWCGRAGSMHLAYHDDEAQVIQDFAQECLRSGENVKLLNPREVDACASAVKSDRLKLGLFSPCEVCVDPREIISGLPEWLSQCFGVIFEYGRAITSAEAPFIFSGSSQWSASRVWICSGDELGLLYPAAMHDAGLVRCKLQMMRSQPVENDWRMGPMLAAGLTLRHYESFQNSPSLPALKERIARESPLFDRFGIHVMACQNGLGELTIGDSHEYGLVDEPFDKTQVDDLILSYLRTFLVSPALKIASRWHGVYVKHPREPYLILHPAQATTVVTGLGGAGMTLSFGLAEAVVSRELGE